MLPNSQHYEGFALHYMFELSYFLLSETQPFVDKLFEAVNNKSYLPQSELPSTLGKVEKDEQKKDEVIVLEKLNILKWRLLLL